MDLRALPLYRKKDCEL